MRPITFVALLTPTDIGPIKKVVRHFSGQRRFVRRHEVASTAPTAGRQILKHIGIAEFGLVGYRGKLARMGRTVASLYQTECLLTMPLGRKSYEVSDEAQLKVIAKMLTFYYEGG